jgi:hypothetical protein
MSIARQHLVRRVSALILMVAAVPLGAVAVSSPASAAALATACPAGDLVGTTYTLTANCAVTEPITVPDGVTLDGGGFTVTATDPGGGFFKGGVVTNAGASMNIQNLTVTGPAAGFAADCAGDLIGVYFNDASGSMTDVTVRDITQNSGCILGRGIRVRAEAGTARTVTMTRVVSTGYQRNGLIATGQATVNVTGSTFGPGDDDVPPGLVAQNSVQYGAGGTGGTFTGNTVVGRAFGAASNSNTAMLLFGASNLTIRNNTITGAGTDVGIFVTGGSTGITIGDNAIGRTAPELPDADTAGVGIFVDAEGPNSATLICNTFSGWKPDQDIVGAIQIGCTPLPGGAECQGYSAQSPTVEGDATAPFTWTVASGNLPPGLILAPNGNITGTSPDNSVGTYKFSLQVVTANQRTATSPQQITIASGCQAALSTPHVRTAASHDRVIPGESFRDKIHVGGLASGHVATAVARLYGPFASRADAACHASHLVRSQTLHVRNGTHRTSPVKVNAPGVYTWRVTINADAATASATHRCGQAAETTLVAKPGYVAPAIQGGFSGTIDSPPALDRRAPLIIQMPGIGVNALIRPEGVVDGKMTLPGDVSEVGWLQKSAGIGDKLGTAVLGGHVSDRHDTPGAMFHLNRARAGQQITVTAGGKAYRFKVVGKATFDRRSKLPHRYFTTTGQHRLVLISCTGRVVFPNGHFHYTRYAVVVADQMRPHK